MRFTRLIAFCLTVLLTLSLSISSLAESFTAKVIGITDGDTLTVLKDGQPVKVRLNGIDAPESKQPFGEKSKLALSDLCYGKTITINSTGQDRYQRTLADITVEGVNVNQSMIQSGMAYHYKQYSKDEALAKAEIAAKQRGIGVWSQPNATAPWEYRQERRESSTTVGGSGGQVGPGTATISGDGASVGVSGVSQSGGTTYRETVIPPSGAIAGGRTTIQVDDVPPPQPTAEKTVYVNGYTRKDGTVVQPYYRTSPKKGK